MRERQQLSKQDRPLLEAILEALPELVFVLDRDGRYHAVLGGRDDLRYHDGSSLVGKLLHDVLPAEVADSFLGRIREALDTGSVVTHEYQLSSEDVEGVEGRVGVSDELWFEGRVAPVKRVEGGGELAVWMLFNITESKRTMQRLEEQQRELERLARTDPLTGLLNRRSFFAEAARELAWVQRTGAPAVLLQLDLDLFKRINDTYGHAAGDHLLREVADLLRTDRRASDVLARLGGEEFALLVRGVSLEDGHRLAERLRAQLAALRVDHDGQELTITGSFGVAALVADDQVPDAALQRADAAMYTAKRGGRDGVEVAGRL